MASFFYTQDESAHIDTREQGSKTVKARPSLSRVQSGKLRRTEVAPPDLFQAPAPTWRRRLTKAWSWVLNREPAQAGAAEEGELGTIQEAFLAAMWDLQSLQANQVRIQVEQARSLRELWHLRAQLFKVISVHRGQKEAETRLDGLNTHFPAGTLHRHDEARSGKGSAW